MSQFVIFSVWSDAKFGTIANLIILPVALPALGNMLFKNKVMADKVSLLKQTGEMKTDPDGRWMDFSAVQYFDVDNPSFPVEKYD